MSNRFYTSDPLSAGEYVLRGPEAHHLASVRRFGPGDRITLFNGDGNEYLAEVIAAERKSVLLNLSGAVAVDRERHPPLTIAAAMPKGDRGDFLIEKLVELGVTRFVPLATERSIVQPKDSRLEKLQHAVIEASKQCGRNVLMQIAGLMKWSDFLAGSPAGWVLHPTESASSWKSGTAQVVAIGPEGGFTDAEAQLALDAGWVLGSLGPRILRIETAAIAAACRFNSLDDSGS